MVNEKWVVDARELLVEIERIYDDHYFRSYDQCVHDIFNSMRRIVRRYAKFRAVEVVHGRWNERDWSGTKVGGFMACSNCNVMIPTVDKNRYCLLRLNYCPNCGAKMDGDGNGTA